MENGEPTFGLSGRSKERVLQDLLALKPLVCGGLWGKYSIPFEVAEDLLQDALLAFWSTSERIEHPQAWLLSVVQHRAVSWLRHAIHEGALFQRENATDLLRAREPRVDLESLLQELPPRQRDVLHHLYYDGESIVEGARRLVTTPETVRQLRKRATMALRKLIHRHPTLSPHPRRLRDREHE
jgi:RNA polymerase sigma factor (sigma-70 family)